MELEHFSIVQKIHDYLEGENWTLDEGLAEAAASAMKHGLVRQIMEKRVVDKKGKLRGSNAGPCSRKMAYQYLGFPEEGKELNARAYSTFLFGDLAEVILVALIKLAGIKTEQTVLDESGQEDLLFKVAKEVSVPGHPDGVLPVQPGLNKPVLLEIKSTSDYAFKNRFQHGTIDEGYILQHHVYLEALGLEHGVFVVYNKNTGDICEVWVDRREEWVKLARRNYRWVLKSDPENLPPRYDDGENYGVRADKKTGRKVLRWGCGYCPYHLTCYGKENVMMEIKSGKPVLYLINEPEE